MCIRDRLWPNQGVSIAIGSCGETVGNAWIHVFIVAKVVPNEEIEVRPKYLREVVFVRDLLDQGPNDRSAFLVDSLVVPVGIQTA